MHARRIRRYEMHVQHWGNPKIHRILLNGQQLSGDDPTTQEPPKPLNICAFYHSITMPLDRNNPYCPSVEFYMEKNGYVIKRGFISGWDKDFANPTQPWSLELSETDEFYDEHQRHVTIQSIMEEIFFHMSSRGTTDRLN